MLKFKVTVCETIAPGSVMESQIELEAANVDEAIAAAKPPYPSKFGRSYVVMRLEDEGRGR